MNTCKVTKIIICKIKKLIHFLNEYKDMYDNGRELEPKNLNKLIRELKVTVYMSFHSKTS